MGPRVILWRHGETDWNAQHRFQGRTDIALNDVGLAQARAAAPFVARWKPTRLVASPLQRAQATAGALAELTGLSVTTVDDVVEVYVGEFEGLTLEEVAGRDPDFDTALAQGRDYRYSPTGESISEVGRRMKQAVTQLVQEASEDDVIVVASHGMAIRAGVAYLMGMDFSRVDDFGFVLNCAWTVLDSTGPDKWRLVVYNQVPPAVR